MKIKLRKINPTGYLNKIDHWYNEYLKFNQKYINYVLDNEGNMQNLSIQPLTELMSHLIKN